MLTQLNFVTTSRYGDMMDTMDTMELLDGRGEGPGFDAQTLMVTCRPHCWIAPKKRVDCSPLTPGPLTQLGRKIVSDQGQFFPW